MPDFPSTAAFKSFFARKTDWNPGDKPWIYLAHHQGERTQGTIVNIFKPPGVSFQVYCIQIETAIDPRWECREAWTMWEKQA